MSYGYVEIVRKDIDYLFHLIKNDNTLNNLEKLGLFDYATIRCEEIKKEILQAGGEKKQ